MAKAKKFDPDRAWLHANATDVEQVDAFKVYAQAHWGMPTFKELRSLVEAKRSSKAYGETGTALPYRPHSDKYFETLSFRFSERTIHRHRDAIMRGAINRDLRASAA